MSRKRAKWAPPLVAPDLPPGRSGPQASLAWPWREKEARAALPEAGTVALLRPVPSPQKTTQSCETGPQDASQEKPAGPLVLLLCLSPNPAEPR